MTSFIFPSAVWRMDLRERGVVGSPGEGGGSDQSSNGVSAEKGSDSTGRER